MRRRIKLSHTLGVNPERLQLFSSTGSIVTYRFRVSFPGKEQINEEEIAALGENDSRHVVYDPLEPTCFNHLTFPWYRLIFYHFDLVGDDRS